MNNIYACRTCNGHTGEKKTIHRSICLSIFFYIWPKIIMISVAVTILFHLFYQFFSLSLQAIQWYNIGKYRIENIMITINTRELMFTHDQIFSSEFGLFCMVRLLYRLIDCRSGTSHKKKQKIKRDRERERGI